MKFNVTEGKMDGILQLLHGGWIPFFIIIILNKLLEFHQFVCIDIFTLK